MSSKNIMNQRFIKSILFIVVIFLALSNKYNQWHDKLVQANPPKLKPEQLQILQIQIPRLDEQKKTLQDLLQKQQKLQELAKTLIQNKAAEQGKILNQIIEEIAKLDDKEIEEAKKVPDLPDLEEEQKQQLLQDQQDKLKKLQDKKAERQTKLQAILANIAQDQDQELDQDAQDQDQELDQDDIAQIQKILKDKKDLLQQEIKMIDALKAVLQKILKNSSKLKHDLFIIVPTILLGMLVSIFFI